MRKVRDLTKKPKALLLFSGGLDSILAAKVLQKAEVEVEALNFQGPFFAHGDWAEKGAKNLGIKLHQIEVGEEYFDIVASPKHGWGKPMNPCVDCKIFMYKKAWEFAKKHYFEFVATGEVLGQRPFSQQLLYDSGSYFGKFY